MGDCRLQILVAKELLVAGEEDSSSSNAFFVVTRAFTADTTVVEVVEEALKPLPWRTQDGDATLLFPLDASLWDCTLHPSKDITDWPLDKFPDKKGPKSKTLYDAGWYPSGTLQVLPVGTSPSVASAETYDDAQYNQPSKIATSSTSSAGVCLVDQQGALPSQVLHSVTQRFDGEQEQSASEALKVRRQLRAQQLQKESERNQKLEERIQQLEQQETSKNKKTSALVRNMLVKSRCTGSKSLDARDRVYLHCVVVSGESTKSEYRYFSRQDTVGRLVTALKSASIAELLIRTGENEYRRLPTTMRLYEAMDQQYLKQVDSIVVRCYSVDSEEPTTSVLEDAMVTEETVEGDQVHEVSTTDNDAEEAAMEDSATSGEIQLERLQETLEAMDEAEASKGKSKKKTKTSAAVRRMQIKGRAKGDTKRVPRMEDRFFLELVVVREESSGALVPSMSYVFLAKTDQVERLLRDCVAEPNDGAILLVPSENGSFSKVSLDLTLKETEAKGTLKPFDRVVVLINKE